jgi:pimeloyl-ACP methyl ester carboxylesterase
MVNMLVILWLVIAILLIALATGIGLSFYFTRRSQLGETHTPDEYGLEYKPIQFTARDGINLRGVWIPAKGSDRAVIYLHGHDSSHDFDIYKAVALHEIGFNVLLFDFRAHGRSDGKMMTYGYKERWDVLAAIEFAQGQGMNHIGLHGTSYGGLTAMLVVPICRNVEAVVSDGGPARLMTGAGAWADERGLPYWLTRAMAWLFFSLTSVRMGINIFKYEPIRWVSKISPCPILFIHGDHDLFCADFDELYAAAKEPKELWRLPEAGHTTASQLYPEEYTQRVTDFFSRYL